MQQFLVLLKVLNCRCPSPLLLTGMTHIGIYIHQDLVVVTRCSKLFYFGPVSDDDRRTEGKVGLDSNSDWVELMFITARPI